MRRQEFSFITGKYSLTNQNVNPLMRIVILHDLVQLELTKFSYSINKTSLSIIAYYE